MRWVGLTQTEAAGRAGISLSGMKSRVQRGRAQLRGIVDACCRFDLDSRGWASVSDPRGRRRPRDGMCDDQREPKHKRTVTRLKRIAGQVEG